MKPATTTAAAQRDLVGIRALGFHSRQRREVAIRRIASPTSGAMGQRTMSSLVAAAGTSIDAAS